MGIWISIFILYLFIFWHRLALICMCELDVGILSLLRLYVVDIGHSLILFDVFLLKGYNVGIPRLLNYKVDDLV